MYVLIRYIPFSNRKEMPLLSFFRASISSAGITFLEQKKSLLSNFDFLEPNDSYFQTACHKNLKKKHKFEINWNSRPKVAPKFYFFLNFFFCHIFVVNVAKVVLKCATHNLKGYPQRTESNFL